MKLVVFTFSTLDSTRFINYYLIVVVLIVYIIHTRVSRVHRVNVKIYKVTRHEKNYVVY